MITDTTSKAEARQHDIFRRMSGEERLRVSMSLSDQMRDIALAGFKSRHPNSSEEELRILFYREIHRVEIKKK
jgi:hypothetical protein